MGKEMFTVFGLVFIVIGISLTVQSLMRADEPVADSSALRSESESDEPLPLWVGPVVILTGVGSVAGGRVFKMLLAHDE